jgi:hypothetical protein
MRNMRVTAVGIMRCRVLMRSPLSPVPIWLCSRNWWGSDVAGRVGGAVPAAVSVVRGAAVVGRRFGHQCAHFIGERWLISVAVVVAVAVGLGLAGSVAGFGITVWCGPIIIAWGIGYRYRSRLDRRRGERADGWPSGADAGRFGYRFPRSDEGVTP